MTPDPFAAAWADYLTWPIEAQRAFHDIADALERRGFTRQEAECAAWATCEDRELRRLAAAGERTPGARS